MSTLPNTLARAFLAALLSAAAFASAAGTVATIRVREQASVVPGALTLRDIAAVAAEPPLADRLRALPIGDAPLPGQARVLPLSELQGWVRTAELPDDLSIRWEGAPSVRVTRRTGAADQAELQAVARNALRQALSSRFSDFRIDNAGAPLPVELPRVRYRYKARDIAVGGALPKRTVVMVELWDGMRLYRAVPVAFNISVYETVLRAQAPLASGEPIQGGLERVRADVTTLGGEYWPADATLDGWRLRRSLAAGQALLRADIEPRPLVARGSTVGLRVKAGPILIESEARVLQDGWKDGLIRVRPLHGTDDVQARVVSASTVEAEIQR